MKRHLLLITFLLIPLYVFSQAPNKGYGEYRYSCSFDSQGHLIENYGYFSRIIPIVVTTNFGFVQSTASYLYLSFGIWIDCGITYSWAGFQNGWYVYTFRMGVDYDYFLISRDLSKVRIKSSYNNGITNEYTKCDPNERMNNAPTN